MANPSKQKNIAITLYVIAGLIIYSSSKFQFYQIIALALLIGLTLIFPFGGLLLAIPIFLVAWVDNYATVINAWNSISGKAGKINAATGRTEYTPAELQEMSKKGLF